MLRCREAYTGALVWLRSVPSTSLHPQWRPHLQTQPHRLSREARGKQAAHPARPVSHLLYVVPALCLGLELKTGEKYISAQIFGNFISNCHLLDLFNWCLSSFACSLKTCSKCLLFILYFISYMHTHTHHSHWENSLCFAEEVWIFYKT